MTISKQMQLDGMPEPTPTSRHTFSQRDIDRAARKVADAERWIVRNPSAWEFVRSMVARARAEGRHIGGRALVEAVRSRDFVGEGGTPTRVCNDFAAVWPRMIAHENPECTSLFTFRTSALDVVMGGGGDAY